MHFIRQAGLSYDPFPLFLATCSAWAAVQMWLWPSEFIGACPPVTIALSLPGYARTWAVYCGIASALKLVGLLGRATHRAPRAATVVMIIGLFMSILFWTVVAGTLSLKAPHSVTPLVFVGLALGAAWQLAGWKPGQER